jgi:hypothetical protein
MDTEVSTKIPQILIMTMSFSSCTHVCMNAFGMPVTATSRSSSAYTMHVSRTDTLATVGELASSLEMKLHCLLSSATVRSLMSPFLFP